MVKKLTTQKQYLKKKKPFIKIYTLLEMLIPTPDWEFDIFFNNNLLTPLKEEQSKKCEGVLTEQECYQALKHMDNGKSPGSDGFTCEFYKFFWDYVKQNVAKVSQ